MKPRAVDADAHIWEAYLRWLRSIPSRSPGDQIRVTEAFRAGYLAAERDLAAEALMVAKAITALEEGLVP